MNLNFIPTPIPESIIMTHNEVDGNKCPKGTNIKAGRRKEKWTMMILYRMVTIASTQCKQYTALYAV
jgi:hypothetical protein